MRDLCGAREAIRLTHTAVIEVGNCSNRHGRRVACVAANVNVAATVVIAAGDGTGADTMHNHALHLTVTNLCELCINYWGIDAKVTAEDDGKEDEGREKPPGTTKRHAVLLHPHHPDAIASRTTAHR